MSEEYRGVEFFVKGQDPKPLTIKHRKDLVEIPRVGEFVCLNEGVFEVTAIQHDLRDYYLGTISIFLKDPNKKELV